MKIYSKFKDYYDSSLSVFTDDAIVYNRQLKVYDNVEDLPSDETIPWSYNHVNKKGNYVSYNDLPIYYIGFCGKWYPCIVSTEKFTKENIPSDYEGHSSFGEKSYPTIESIKDNNNSENPLFFRGDIDYKIPHGTFWEKDIFIKYNAPILLVRCTSHPSHWNKGKWHLEANPMLKCWEFQKKFDPYMAMQELEMFIGNILTNNNTPTMPVGTDEQIRDSKGFDKYSFKKGKKNGKNR